MAYRVHIGIRLEIKDGDIISVMDGRYVYMAYLYTLGLGLRLRMEISYQSWMEGMYIWHTGYTLGLGLRLRMEISYQSWMEGMYIWHTCTH